MCLDGTFDDYHQLDEVLLLLLLLLLETSIIIVLSVKKTSEALDSKKYVK